MHLSILDPSRLEVGQVIVYIKKYIFIARVVSLSEKEIELLRMQSNMEYFKQLIYDYCEFRIPADGFYAYPMELPKWVEFREQDSPPAYRFKIPLLY